MELSKIEKNGIICAVVNSEDLGLCSDSHQELSFLSRLLLPLSFWIVAICSHVNISFSHIQCGPWTTARELSPHFATTCYISSRVLDCRKV